MTRSMLRHPGHALLLLLLLPLSSALALPQLNSPLLPGSVLPPAIADPLDNGFSVNPTAGHGSPLVQTNPTAPTPFPPLSPGAGGGRGDSQQPGGGQTPPSTPFPSSPAQPPSNAPPNPNAPATPVSPALPGALRPNQTNTTGNNTVNMPAKATTGLIDIAPGTNANATKASAASDKAAPDAGLGGLVTAGIVVASVVLASMVGIFLFRKWKLRPKNHRRRQLHWDSAGASQANAAMPPASSSLPLHRAMSQNQNQHALGRPGSPTYDYGAEARYTPAPAHHHHPHHPDTVLEHGVGHHGPIGDVMWQPAGHARTLEMDMALRHHLRNG